MQYGIWYGTHDPRIESTASLSFHPSVHPSPRPAPLVLHLDVPFQLRAERSLQLYGAFGGEARNDGAGGWKSLISIIFLYIDPPGIVFCLIPI